MSEAVPSTEKRCDTWAGCTAGYQTERKNKCWLRISSFFFSTLNWMKIHLTVLSAENTNRFLIYYLRINYFTFFHTACKSSGEFWHHLHFIKMAFLIRFHGRKTNCSGFLEQMSWVLSFQNNHMTCPLLVVAKYLVAKFVPAGNRYQDEFYSRFSIYCTCFIR